MLKRDITYETFDGETITEPFYFNLTSTEIIGLEVDHDGGLEAAIQRIIKANDTKGLIAEFQKLILSSYGVKSDDGKRFIKGPELTNEFCQTNAYDVLFMELATNENAALEFIMGVVPSSLAKQIKESPQEVIDVPLPPGPPSAA